MNYQLHQDHGKSHYERFNLWVFHKFFYNHRTGYVFADIRGLKTSYDKVESGGWPYVCEYLSMVCWKNLLKRDRNEVPGYFGLIAIQVYSRAVGNSLESLCKILRLVESDLQKKFKGDNKKHAEDFYDQDDIYTAFEEWCEKNDIEVKLPEKKEGPGRNVQYFKAFEEIRSTCRRNKPMRTCFEFMCSWNEKTPSTPPSGFLCNERDCKIFDIFEQEHYVCFFQDKSYPEDWTSVRERNLKLDVEKMLLIWRRSDSDGRIAAALQRNGVADVFSRGDYSWALIPQDKQRSLGIFQVGSGVDFRLCGGLKLGRRQWMLGAGPRIDCFGEEGSHRFRYRRVGGEDFKYLNGAHGLVNISELGEFEIWAEGACYNEIRKLEIVEPPFRGNNFREKLGWDVTALRKVGKVYGLDFSKLPVESLKENSSFADAAATAETSRTVVSLKENSSFADWLDTAYGEIFTNRFFNQKLINNNLTKRKIHE